MCLAVPFRLIRINGNEALADRSGVSRNVRVDFIKDPRPGDYVLVHAGFAIEKIDEKQAEEDLQTAGELAEELKKISQEIEQRHKNTLKHV